MQLYIVAGLGNPGPTYERTRHNAGFMVVDRVAEKTGLSFVISRGGVPLALAKGNMAGNTVFLVKPLTFMNRSGHAVSHIASYYKVPRENIIAVHDDLDLAMGRIKFTRGGGHGGHNGVRSLVEQLGGTDFPRLRIGIGRPVGPQSVESYVLSPFDQRDTPVMERILDLAADGILCFIEKGLSAAMNEYNGIHEETGV
ncbi:MAG: aminoacyl-tRNA hydrolase [Deltaproteobacteria bacterium]